MSGASALQSAFEHGDAAGIKFRGNIVRGKEHLADMADQAKTSDVGHGVNGKSKTVVGRWSLVVGGSSMSCNDYFGGDLVQSCHRGDGSVYPRLLGYALLDGG